MNSQIPVNEILQNDLWLPTDFTLEKGLKLIECTPDTFKLSTFLDGRIKETTGNSTLLSYDAYSKFPFEPPANLSHIFHISHVGSTLIAKVLGDASRLRVFREPTIVKSLESHFQAIPGHTSPYSLKTLNQLAYYAMCLLCRGPQDHTVIKHTSHNSLIIDKVITTEKSNSIALYTGLENYVAHAAGSGATKGDVTQSMTKRIGYLNRHADFLQLNLADFNGFEMAGCLWLSEMHKLTTASLKFDDMMFLDFDNEMNNKRQFVDNLNSGLNLNLNNDELEHLANSEEWNRASKQANLAYGQKERMRKIRASLKNDHFYIQKVVEFVWDFCDQNPSFTPLIPYIG